MFCSLTTLITLVGDRGYRVPLATWCDARGKPHYATGIVNGKYLLVAGFPGDKPVSPEMEAARTEYLAAFAAAE